MEIYHNSRKDIIVFLTPYLDLPQDIESAWKKIKRWKKKYSLPIEYKPNGTPILDEAVFLCWWNGFRETRRGRLYQNHKVSPV